MQRRNKFLADLHNRRKPMNNMIYEPNLTDRDFWEHNMFHIVDPPPKLSHWQDYFVRYIRGDEGYFTFFLHYYEPVLNEIVKRFGCRYGLQEHFADLKMAYVEAMLTQLQLYKPDCGIDFLRAVSRKLYDSLYAYAMTNLKGFSEASMDHYRRLRKAAYIYKTCSPGNEISTICKALKVQSKTAQSLIDEICVLDAFQWCGEVWNETDIPVGVDILGYRNTLPPEQIFILNEDKKLLTEVFEALTEKEQDIIALHLGFCHNCFCPQVPKTYDEIADIYQFSTVNGVQRFYKRALDKLRSKLNEKEFFTKAD